MPETIDGRTLAEFMKQVNREVYKIAMISVHDLADCCFWDMWHDGMSPRETAIEALDNDSLYSGFMSDLL
jgi:hypothetical protein